MDMNETNITELLCPENGTAAMHSTWIFVYFGECVLNIRQYFAFVIGMLSILCWLFAQVPQLVTNCRTGEADKALSFWFLFQWLVGDATNLIGAFLTRQLATQIATAVYFVLVDSLAMAQFLYYVVKNQGTKGLLNCFKCSFTHKRSKEPAFLAVLLPGLMCSVLLVGTTRCSWSYTVRESSYYSISPRSGRTLLGLDGVVVDPNSGEDVAGYIFGCLSAVFYVCSRIPQVVKNFARCSVEGLSLYMFILALLGNITYGLGIFLYSVDPVFLLQKLPWIVGSVGTIVFDIIIVFQFVATQCMGISCARRQYGGERKALLSSVRDSQYGSLEEEDPAIIHS